MRHEDLCSCGETFKNCVFWDDVGWQVNNDAILAEPYDMSQITNAIHWVTVETQNPEHDDKMLTRASGRIQR